MAGGPVGGNQGGDYVLQPVEVDPIVFKENMSFPVTTVGVSATLEDTNFAAVAFQPRVAHNGRGGPSEVAYPVTAEAGRAGKGDSAQCVAFAWDEELNAREELAGTLSRGGEGGRHDGVMQSMAVRRLMPVECERLQGFPDNYTDVPYRNKPASDGPRYKALGNSMACNVMRWIGQRIQMVEDLNLPPSIHEQEAA